MSSDSKIRYKSIKTENTQCELPRSSSPLDVCELSSDEDYKLISSTFPDRNAEEANPTESEEGDSDSHLSQNEEITSGTCNWHAEATVGETNKRKLINDDTATFYPLNEEKRDTGSINSVAHSSRESGSPPHQANITSMTEAKMNNTQQNDSSSPECMPLEQKQDKNAQQQMKTSYSSYSNDYHEPVLSVKLKLCMEGSHRQRNRFGVHFRERIASGYLREEGNPRRDVGYSGSTKRYADQDLGHQSQSSRSRKEVNMNRHTKNGASQGTSELESFFSTEFSKAFETFVAAVITLVCIVVIVIMVCFFCIQIGA